jgi:hypothetical protein
VVASLGLLQVGGRAIAQAVAGLQEGQGRLAPPGDPSSGNTIFLPSSVADAFAASFAPWAPAANSTATRATVHLKTLPPSPNAPFTPGPPPTCCCRSTAPSQVAIRRRASPRP